MSNEQKPATATPQQNQGDDNKPAVQPQQNQGDNKPSTEKPAQQK